MSLDLQPSGSNQLGLRSGGQLVVTISYWEAGWGWAGGSQCCRTTQRFVSLGSVCPQEGGALDLDCFLDCFSLFLWSSLPLISNLPES